METCEPDSLGSNEEERMSNRAELIELVENWLHPGPRFPVYILGNNNLISQVALKVKNMLKSLK